MRAAVSVLITDLRREPTVASRGYEKDLLQETQLLYGERVNVFETRDGWSFIEALHQPKYIRGEGWQGYRGWIDSAHITPCKEKISNYVVQDLWTKVYAAPSLEGPALLVLPFGACCEARPSAAGWAEVSLLDGKVGYFLAASNKPMLERAAFFLGHPYLWGGCSPYSESVAQCNTSVDCSGLIHLLFRSVGRTVPRDASDQQRFANTIVKPKSGDLVFRSDPHKDINHVLLYMGGEELIEACLEPKIVRRITFTDKFGASLRDILNGNAPKEHCISFGRFDF